MIPTTDYEKNNSFRITVVIPVYNVEDYLDECLTGIINQTLGFEKIQVILINDGSSDRSGAICEKYKLQYPNNIIYIQKENGGVASARNIGLEIAGADLITFLDGDDKWSEDAFEIAYKAYRDNPDIKVFSCRMNFFDAEEGEHQLNYKYETDKTIWIEEDYNYPQLSASSVFIETETARNFRFDTNLKYSEDCKYINEVLLDSGRMIVLSEPVYFYRKRNNGSSAMQKSVSDTDYYIPTCRHVYRYLMDLSTEKYGKVLRYIQYCVMYDLRWRLKIPLSETGLSDGESEEYQELLIGLLRDIDDDIILEQKRIALALQMFALELKHGKEQVDRLSCTEDGIISVDGYKFYDIKKQFLYRIDDVELEEDKVLIKGQADSPLREDELSLDYSINGEKHNLNTERTDENIKKYLFGELKSNRAFVIEECLNYRNANEIAFYVSCKNKSFMVRPRLSGRKKTATKGRIPFVNDGKAAFISDGRLIIKRLSRVEFLKETIRKMRG